MRRVVDNNESRSNKDMVAVTKPLSSTLSKYAYTASQRTVGATLFAQEIADERLIEVEEENASLKIDVLELEDEVKRLTALLEAASEHTPKVASFTQQENMESNTFQAPPFQEVGVADNDIKFDDINAE